MPEIASTTQTNGHHKCPVDANNNGVEVAEGCCKGKASALKETAGVQYSNGKETTPFKPVTHVIFDLDGLLIDSEQRFANAIAILLKRFGKIFFCLCKTFQYFLNLFLL